VIGWKALIQPITFPYHVTRSYAWMKGMVFILPAGRLSFVSLQVSVLTDAHYSMIFSIMCKSFRKMPVTFVFPLFLDYSYEK
jgi:hypothetical protein